MDEIIILRTIKFFSLALFAGGIFAAVLAAEWPRRIAALPLTTIGFTGSWISGYVLMVFTGGSMRTMELWIIWGIVASLLALHGVALLAHKAQPHFISYILTLTGLFTSIATMVTRSNQISQLMLATLFSLIFSFIICFWPGLVKRTQSSNQTSPEVTNKSWHWFQWIARWEGISLIVLILINMPLKQAAGISLDGGTGTLGWFHGTLFLIYLQALLSTGRLLNWNLRQFAFGFISANIPFGTFWFERWVQKSFREDQPQKIG